MIFTYVITGILVLVSLLVQSHTSFDVIRIAEVKPDLLFIVIVYLSYNFGPFYGQSVGFIGGLLNDAISLSPLGLMTFPKMALGFLVGMFGRDLFKSSFVTVTLLVFVASLLKNIVTLFLCYIFAQGSVMQVLTVILPESIYNAVISPLLFFLFDKIFERELDREGIR
jgi:rod shape-determining protein MreD